MTLAAPLGAEPLLPALLHQPLQLQLQLELELELELGTEGPGNSSGLHCCVANSRQMC